MNPHACGGESPQSILITGVAVLAILAIRLTRSRTARPLRMGYMWIWPAIVIVLGSLSVFVMISLGRSALSAAAVGIMAASLVAGGAVGWWRGRFMRIEVHPETQVVMVQASAMAMVVIIGLFLVRYALRYLFRDAANPCSPGGALINADFILFAIGILAVARIEMWMRAQRRIEEARVAAQASS